MWKRKRKTELLPWYRTRSYKGKMTESQKRELDAFRSQELHPAADYDSLPTEVQHYINRLEMEIYDDKQKTIAARALFVTGIGVLLAYQMYFGGPEPTPWGYAASALFMVVPWFVYSYAFKKNANEFLPDDPGPNSPTDEGIRMEWEIEYLGRRRQARNDN